MLCTHFLMTEFTDVKYAHPEPPKLPHTHAYNTHTHNTHTYTDNTRVAVVELPTTQHESSLLRRCTRHMRKLNLQTMFYNV